MNRLKHQRAVRINTRTQAVILSLLRAAEGAGMSKSRADMLRQYAQQYRISPREVTSFRADLTDVIRRSERGLELRLTWVQPAPSS